MNMDKNDWDFLRMFTVAIMVLLFVVPDSWPFLAQVVIAVACGLAAAVAWDLRGDFIALYRAWKRHRESR